MKKLLLGILSLLAVGQFALALPADAQGVQQGGQDALNQLNETGLGGGTSPSEAGKQLPQLIGRIIRTILGILGIIFLVLVVYAGFLWMTARGDEGKVEKAVDIIKQATIGLVIIFLAYAITGFIVNLVVKATSNQP